MKGLPEADEIRGCSYLSAKPHTRFFVRVLLCVCVHTAKAEAALHHGELSHVSGTELQAILSLFVLLPPQGPPLAQLASTCACLVR